jgi:hypothetical protein
LSIDLRAVTHRLIQIEPGIRQRRTVKHQAINIYQTSAARALDLANRIDKLGMLGFFDERYASHKHLELPTLDRLALL